MDKKVTNKELWIVFVLFIFFSVWRFLIIFLSPAESDFNLFSFFWGATYQIIAIWGGVRGLMIARPLGGIKSKLGRTVAVFSIGLLFQSLGQSISSYYVYTTGNIPYPSLGDIGFFGSTVFYVYGVYLLARVSGVYFSLKNYQTQLVSFLLFALMMLGSYLLFLRGHDFDFSYPTEALLNIGYPFVQAAYVAIAVLTLLLTRNYLGGMLRSSMLFFLFALISQYISDFVFLYQANYSSYIPEGLTDYLYCFSYFVMAAAVLFFGRALQRFRDS